MMRENNAMLNAVAVERLWFQAHIGKVLGVKFTV
ncbi:hypothetical protein Thivi_1080 [Thiocystis violascens DSM 198]|uniref:Uncharacterized protein n=1 Tax=Thiocystis violascens (strain ATCC 17096 / DSM 198 / 6111) TaxID=765911 RepID=I3Y7Z3_THIV6|nr:hypothetical protein Thivi_1080 [Thiocystis violascens DSM 198]